MSKFRARSTAAIAFIALMLTLALAGGAQAEEGAPAPTISGDPVVGETLTALPSDDTFSYQWYAAGVPIEGATAAAFVPGADQANEPLTVRVTRPDAPDEPETSEPTLLVATASSPTISGDLRVGATVRAVTGAWSPATSFTYRWTAGGTPLAEASGTLSIPESARDQQLAVTVEGTSTGYPVVTRSSAPTDAVMLTGSPTVTGTYAVGSTLWADAGSWSSGTNLSYRWYANNKPIAGAVDRSFRLTSGQGSRTIRVEVKGQKLGYATQSRTSATSAKVFTAAGTPVITGTPAVGKKLTIAKGTWMSGSKISYRWYANGTLIRGAIKSTYTLSSSTAAKQITSTVTGSRAGYATVVRTSKGTARIQRIGKPSLSGSTTATNRLTAKPGSWVSGTKFTYAWYLNGKKISGATSSSIYVKPSWKGKKLSAKVTGKLSGYRTFTASSSSSKAITLPGRTDPVSSWNCPSWAPIKGNESSMIYHLPGQRFYSRTKPEDCFSTEKAARSAGYRKAKV